MKDLKWLEEKVREMRRNVSINKNYADSNYAVGGHDALEKVLELIDQVEQPEVTEEQALSKIAERHPLTSADIARILNRHIASNEVEQPDLLKIKKIKINPSQLFNSKNDVRQYMRVDIRDEEYKTLADEHGANAVDDIVASASIYFRADEIPKEMELELVDYQLNLPVIPDYVAEYIESRKQINFPMYQSIRIIFESSRFIGTQINKWLHSNENKETFTRAWLIGYTVEEKKYTAQLKIIGENIASHLRTQHAVNRLDNLEIGSNYIHEDYRQLSEFTKEELKKLGLWDNKDWRVSEVTE